MDDQAVPRPNNLVGGSCDRRHRRYLGGVLLCIGVTLSVAGQEPDRGFKASFDSEWDSAVRRFEAIAEAIPKETYGWRPKIGRAHV